MCVIFKDVVGPEEMTNSQPEHHDSEFEGMGDYEESFLAEWWQEPKTKWDTGEVADWHLERLLIQLCPTSHDNIPKDVDLYRQTFSDSI